jgi:hypothetical protein
MINIESRAWKILSPSGEGTKDYFLFMTRFDLGMMFHFHRDNDKDEFDVDAYLVQWVISEKDVLEANAQEILRETKDEFFKMVKKYNERGELKRLYKELTQRELTCRPDWYVKWEED